MLNYDKALLVKVTATQRSMLAGVAREVGVTSSDIVRVAICGLNAEQVRMLMSEDFKRRSVEVLQAQLPMVVEPPRVKRKYKRRKTKREGPVYAGPSKMSEVSSAPTESLSSP